MLMSALSYEHSARAGFWLRCTIQNGTELYYGAQCSVLGNATSEYKAEELIEIWSFRQRKVGGQKVLNFFGNSVTEDGEVFDGR